MKNQECFIKAISARKIQQKVMPSRLHLIMAQINSRIQNFSMKGMKEGKLIVYGARGPDFTSAITQLKKAGYGIKTLGYSEYQFRWEFALSWHNDKKFRMKHEKSSMCYRTRLIKRAKEVYGYNPKVNKDGFILYSKEGPPLRAKS